MTEQLEALNGEIIVAVSPFYNGPGWKDEFSNIEFKPSDNYYPIRISTSRNLKGIRRSLRLNSLILLDGKLPDGTDPELNKIDPAELSRKQLKEIAEGSAEDTGELEQKVKDLNSKATSLESSKKEVESKLSDAESEVKEAKSNLSDAETERDKAKSDLEAAKTDKEKAESELKDAQDAKTKAENDKKTAESQLTAKNSRIEYLEGLLTDNEIDFDDAPTEAQTASVKKKKATKKSK